MRATPPKAVEGIEKALTIQVFSGGLTNAFAGKVRAVFGQPGLYAVDVIPTLDGSYKFKVGGKIESTDVNETFESGPNTFNDVQGAAPLQYPQRCLPAPTSRGSCTRHPGNRGPDPPPRARDGGARDRRDRHVAPGTASRVVRRLLLALVLAAGSAVLLGGVAAAHATYVKSNPGSDARLQKPPTEVRVTFSETPDPKGSELQVLDTDGKRHDKADVATAPDEPNTLRVTLGPIGEGGYLVSWTAVSGVDGHETKGAFAFAVGNAPLPAIPDVGPSAPPPGPLEPLGRAFSFEGLAAVLGVAFFGLFVRERAEDGERRRERTVLLGSAALLIVGALVLLAQPNVPQRLAALLLVRALAGAAVIGVVWLPGRRVAADARREVIAFAGLAAALTATLVSTRPRAAI